MANTRYQDLQKREDLIRSGLEDYIHIKQNLNVLNASSNNALFRYSEFHPGDYFEQDFIDIGTDDADDLRRDPNSEGTYTWKRISEGTEKAIKVHRRIGRSIYESAIYNTRRMTPEQYMFRLGRGLGRSILKEQIDSVLGALVACLSKQDSTKVDSNGHFITEDLQEGMKQMGDSADNLVAIVGHSNSFWTLVGDQYEKDTTGLTDFVATTGVPKTMLRPYIQIDNSSLVNTPDNPTELKTLVLVPNAGQIVLTAPERVYTSLDLDFNNVANKYTVEYEYNLAIKGFSWDSTANPDATNLENSDNWSMEVDTVKQGPGVVIVSNLET